MASTRSSRRLAGVDANAPQSAGRRKKPSTNSLAAFDQPKDPQPTQNNSYKRRRAQTVQSEPIHHTPSTVTSTPAVQRPKLSAGQKKQDVVDLGSPPPALPLSPATVEPTTKGKQATFNPNTLYDKPPQWVRFTVIPYINKKPQNSIVKSYNINSIQDRITWKVLCELVSERGIKPWAEARFLDNMEWPIRLAWEVVFGSLKTSNHRVTILNEETFIDAMVQLRIFQRNGSQAARNVNILAYFKTIDREASESDDNSKRPKTKKSKSKSDRARETNRPTPLGAELSQSIDPDDDFDQLPGDDDISVSVSTPSKRDSVTARRLNDKRERDSTLAPEEVNRALIFSTHLCTERLCENKTKCCYIMPRAGTHHRIDPVRQSQWAAHINAKMNGCTLQRPPIEWLAGFLEGDLQTNFRPKSYGTRKPDPIIPETTPKPDQASSAMEQLMQLILLQQVQKMASNSTTSTASNLEPVLGTDSLPLHNAPAESRISSIQNQALMMQGQGNCPMPLLPLRPTDDDENQVELMGVWLVERERNSKRREHIKLAFGVFDEAFVTDLSQVKDVLFMVNTLDVKPGIAHYICQQVSAFKESYKARKSAAEGLLTMGGGAVGRQIMGRAGSGAGSGDHREVDDYFADY